MEMKRATVILAFVLSMGTLLAQQGPPPAGPGWRAPHWDALKSYLQLSDKQVQDLTALLTSLRETVKPIHEQIRTEQKQLKQEMGKTSPDSSLVAQSMVEVKNLRSQIKAKRDGLQPQLLALLSDSQKSQLATLQQALTVEQVAHQAAALGLIEAPQDHSEPAGLRGGRRGRP
jgi:Spy/CpxP family protein refolding chaperone